MVAERNVKRRPARAEGDAAWFAASQLAAIVDNSDAAVIATDLDGVILTWNAAAQRLFGRSAEEAIGQSIFGLIPPRFREQERHLRERLENDGAALQMEALRVSREGKEIPFSICLAPIRDPQGCIVGAVRIMRDTSGERRTEASLADAQQQLQRSAHDLEERVQERTVNLQQTVSELEAFSYSLSHDMRAPLRAIQNYSQIVLEECRETMSPSCAAYLHKVVASAERLDRLILDLLNFARLSQAEMALQPVDTDRLVREIVQERAEFQLPSAETKIESPLLAVQGNEASLTQCVTNLLGNAVKYIARGVRPVIRIWSEGRDGGVRLWFEDNGIGIDAAGQRRLFQMFQRIHAGEYEGMGIGLAIVRKAVERMRGSAGVESEPGKGSRFWLQLPGAVNKS